MAIGKRGHRRHKGPGGAALRSDVNRDWSKVGRKKPKGKGESNPVGKTAARARTLTRNTGIVHYACKTRGGVWRTERWKDSRTWPDLSPPDELG